MKKIFGLLELLTKIVVILGILITAYYIFIIKPKVEFTKNIAIAENSLSTHLNYLIQNRIACVALTQLDSDSANFQADTSALFNTLLTSQKSGLETVTKYPSIPDIKKSQLDYSKLISETENLYNDQKILIEAVMKTESYKDGLEILKSGEAIELLTKQTNLILEYQFWLNRIKE